MHHASTHRVLLFLRAPWPRWHFAPGLLSQAARRLVAPHQRGTRLRPQTPLAIPQAAVKKIPEAGAVKSGQKRSKAVKRPAPLASYRQRGRPGVPPRLLTVSICIQACACASPEPRACVRGSTGTAQRRGRPALASARRPLRTPFPAPRSASDYLALLLISFSRVSRVARGPRQSTAAPDTPCRPAACSS